MGSGKRSNHLVPKGEERLKTELRKDIALVQTEVTSRA
jgi:hypothetical protein